MGALTDPTKFRAARAGDRSLVTLVTRGFVTVFCVISLTNLRNSGGKIDNEYLVSVYSWVVRMEHTQND